MAQSPRGAHPAVPRCDIPAVTSAGRRVKGRDTRGPGGSSTHGSPVGSPCLWDPAEEFPAQTLTVQSLVTLLCPLPASALQLTLVPFGFPVCFTAFHAKFNIFLPAPPSHVPAA